MIDFIKSNNKLILRYEPDRWGTKWIEDLFRKDETLILKRTFFFNKENLYNASDYLDILVDNDIYNGEQSTLGETELFGDENDELFEDGESIFDDAVEFIVGEREESYYRIYNEILNVTNQVRIHESINIKVGMFIAYNNISIFRAIDRIVNQSISIGPGENDLPEIEFLNLMKKFPNKTELDKYSAARVNGLISNYFDLKSDEVRKYESYIERYKTFQTELLAPISNSLSELEYEKYNLLLNELKYMLQNENEFDEKAWQHKILNIITLIYPKYINVLEEARIRDVYNNCDRRLDFTLIDFNGNIDIIEIKRPIALLISKTLYRDNFIPLKELTGTVMQVEKYLYYLNKWGIEGEKSLTRQYKDKFSETLNIKIINPHGILVMGRSNELRGPQIDDFELIKRKYKNVVDIITYDDLIQRLERLINKFKIN